MKKLIRIIAVCFLISLYSCSDYVVTEISRSSNNAATVDAIVAEKETGATVATPTEVYIVTKGLAISGEPVFRADKVEALKLVWLSESKLVIHADKARVFLNSPEVKINLQGEKSIIVEIQLDIKDMK